MLQITVGIFSGRPDPSWVVDGDEAEAILREIATNRQVITEVHSGYQGLGYRGVSLELLTDDLAEEYDLPSSFMIANGTSGDESKGLEIATQLAEGMSRYSTADEPEAGSTALDDELQTLVLGELSSFQEIVSLETPKQTRLSELDLQEDDEARSQATCYIELGKFNPGFWNDNSYVRNNNNCYNYARNWRTNTFAQPGRASGYYPYAMQCDRVGRGALSDGAHLRYVCFPDSEKPRWLMALVVWPGVDYHWYRKQREGFWGHKPGSTPAKNTDNSGNVITNPQTCNRGNYTEFCGYYYACKSMRIR